MRINYKPIHVVECNYDQLFNDGKYEDAISLMQQFLQESKDNPYGQMLAYISIASCFFNLNKIEQAFEHMLHYKDLCVKYGNDMDYYTLYHLYSLIYCQEQNYMKAIEAAEKCIELATKMQVHQEMVESNNLLSTICIFTNAYEKALSYAQKAQTIAYANCYNDFYLICAIHCNLASAHAYLNNVAEAENTLLLLEQNPYIQNISRERSRYFYTKGLLKLKSSDIAGAIAAFEEAKQIAQSLQDITVLKYIFKQLAHAFEQTNNIEYAYRYLKEYVSLSDKLNYKQSTSKIVQLDTNHHVETISQRANLDALSNVYNRYYLESICDEWLRSSRKTKSSVCCIAFDVDNFKQINDTYGHLMGDEVIKVLGTVCNDVMRNIDGIVGRYGGDEFVVLVRNHSDHEVLRIAQTLFNQLSETKIYYEGNEVQFTISMGIVCNNSIIARKFTQLFRVADQALYMAKSQGKNQIVTLANTNCNL